MTYKITCHDCQNSDTISINEGNIIWGKNTFIISGRRRLDNQWGWQCFCGNNDLMTRQEVKYITNKQNPDPQEIKQILNNLKPDKPKFLMEQI